MNYALSFERNDSQLLVVHSGEINLKLYVKKFGGINMSKNLRFDMRRHR